MTTARQDEWRPLSLLTEQFRANVAALTVRYPSLAHKLVELPPAALLVSTSGARVRLAEPRDGEPPREVADPAPPPAARQVAARIYPAGACTFPLLVAGLGYGWLWQQLYAMPVSTPALPGHRPPLYFVAGNVSRLHAILHLHDWRAMFADKRVQLFAGPDAIPQLVRTLRDNVRLPWPKLAVTLDPTVWPVGRTFDGLIQSLAKGASRRVDELRARNDAAYLGLTAPASASKLASGESLRILGITSRYTTFLQHSMRDWLAAFEQLGHTTRLVIEHADHEVMNNLVYAEACADFRPDLVVLIDHYRAELRALPDAVPCAMWVQDRLPNIFSARAGAAQTSRDFVLGFGRQECVDTFGYPESRFLPSRIGVNADRFAPRELTADETARFACDVSYVSHASATAESIVDEAMAVQSSPEGRRLLSCAFERLRGIYDVGRCLTEAADMKDIITAALAETQTSVPDLAPLIDLFLQRVNNALFRHQTLAWLVGLDIDLRIYGKGWERHPKFARFARGVADNQAELSAIYQASRINLQATPHGAVHQRLTDGLSAGGFFIIRHTPADVVENVYRPIREWCVANQVHTDQQLQQRATPEITALLGRLRELKGRDPFGLGVPLVTSLALAADGDYTCSAASVWPEYERVQFDSAASAREKVAHFLAHDEERRGIAASMRRQVLDRLTYTAMTRRMLGMMAGDLAKQSAALTPTARAA